MKTPEPNYFAALDTSSQLGSFAVASEEAFLFETSFHSKPNAESLVLDIDRCFRDLGLDLHQVKTWSVVTGPGSFTGARLGLALVKGICFATKANLVGVSLFDLIWQRQTCDFSKKTHTAMILPAGQGEHFIEARDPEGFVLLEASVIPSDKVYTTLISIKDLEWRICSDDHLEHASELEIGHTKGSELETFTSAKQALFYLQHAGKKRREQMATGEPKVDALYIRPVHITRCKNTRTKVV